MSGASTFTDHYRNHRFTILFCVLLLSIAGHGLVGRLLPVTNPMDWLLAISLVAVVFSAPKGRLRWTLGLLTVACAVGRLAQGLLASPALAFFSQTLVGVACLVAAGVAMRRALTPAPVTSEHLTAALDVYLLAGIAFGIAYWLLDATLPGSFASASPDALTPARAIYFSFVTQATLGFGDIVPVPEHAQGLVIAQGIGGQMYLAVLVARLVSLFSATDQASSKSGHE